MAEVDEGKAEHSGFALVGRGRRMLQIVEGDVKQNSKRTGDVFNFKVECVEDGEFNGAKFFSSINVSHEKPNVRAQGQAQLKALALAQGQDPLAITDTDQYLWQPFLADIDIVANTYQGVTKDQNTIVRFVFEGNQNLPIPGTAPANDNKAQPTAGANDNTPQTTTASNPSTARTTPNGGAAASSAGGGRSMPWKKN
ncbi:MAG TPA: hypothetical protein VGC77_11065 [Rhodopseudomonas sp.]